MVVRWTFTDQSIPITETFDVNPNEGGTPSSKKTVKTQPTTAPDGIPLMFEAADEPSEFEWAGVFLRETQYNMFTEWYNKHHQILLTDDLGRTFWVYITQFDIKRQRAAHYGFKHKYTAKATLLDWE